VTGLPEEFFEEEEIWGVLCCSPAAMAESSSGLSFESAGGCDETRRRRFGFEVEGFVF
jgi:hypothetical protein